MAASEAGGITQGIGAYKVQVPVDGNLRPCVFLDTPGHEVSHHIIKYCVPLLEINLPLPSLTSLCWVSFFWLVKYSM